MKGIKNRRDFLAASGCWCWGVVAFGVGRGLGLAGERGGEKYGRREVLGWSLRVHRELEEKQADALKKALELLEKQLREVLDRVPDKAVVELRKVPLWMSPEYSGIVPRAEYHPGEGWLKENGREPAMAKGVEFTNIRIFDEETRRMPNFALHELAHAYHDRVLGFESPEIEAVYQKARAGGRYERVERRGANGEKAMDRAYAMVNAKEYFAELTEAYFSRNDFFPFVRDELKAFDPGGFRMVEEKWGLR